MPEDILCSYGTPCCNIHAEKYRCCIRYLEYERGTNGRASTMVYRFNNICVSLSLSLLSAHTQRPERTRKRLKFPLWVHSLSPLAVQNEVTEVNTSDIATSFSQDSVARLYEIRLTCLAKNTVHTGYSARGGTTKKLTL